MQPNYSKLDVKINARKENFNIFRKITGLQSIPKNKEYWTLCNIQDPDNEGTEIVQLEKLGLLKKNQFNGVDNNEDIIKQNKIWHPKAHWHYGDWIQVIRNCDKFNPALIYLDTTSFSNCESTLDVLCTTMILCPTNTLLLVNAILNNFYGKDNDPKILIKNLSKSIPSAELKKWRTKIEMYGYNATGKTDMITYILYKEGKKDGKEK